MHIDLSRRISYDTLSRRLSETRPLGQTLGYAYDERDRLKTWTNSRGQQVRHDYHPWGPLLQSRHYANAAATTPLRSIGYTYDNRANLTATTDDSIQPGPLWSASYDLLDRAMSTRAHYIPGAAAGIWVDQAWDRYGNLQSEGIRNASSGEVLSTSYTYDTRNRVAGAALPAGANLTVTSNEADQRTNLAYPNATNQATTYLANGNVDIITLAAPGGATLERWDYAYDAASNVDTITTTQGVYDYGYDGLDRLTTGTYPAATGLAAETYTYDPLGNRELPGNLNAYQYDANNRMTVAPGYYANTYDDDGSLVGRSGAGGVSVAAQYDATNRPTTWATESLSLSNYVDYAHEPQGRRIRVHAEKVTGINTTETTAHYLWAGDRIVAEYDAAGIRTIRYAYLPGDYAPVQQASATATTYLHSDRLQTPRRGTSSVGVITWKGDYRSFGDGTPNTDPDGNGQAVVVKHRFPGQYADASGLSYNYFRDYDPSVGRYVESDPIGLKGGINTYVYAGSSPIRNVDPLGLLFDDDNDEFDDDDGAPDFPCRLIAEVPLSNNSTGVGANPLSHLVRLRVVMCVYYCGPDDTCPQNPNDYIEIKYIYFNDLLMLPRKNVCTPSL